ncbi:sigma factor [Edaphocola flava]|uniref:sigma factor n=1 Tax=Edaphocola flava TaxID=2499629 RepID=UPI00100BE8AA|nr:sigma factor [Edaphocola flava]
MDTVFWENVITQLLAYADQLLKTHAWFRGKASDTSIKGRQAEDYVQETIARYLDDPDNYDPSKGELIKYLKYYILRRLVSNDSKSLENTVNIDLFGWKNDDLESDMEFWEKLMPVEDCDFDSNIDFEQILNDICHNLVDDPECTVIFNLTRKNGYKRREVIREVSFTEDQFDNAMKRLNRILKKVAKKYSINQTL